MLKSIGTDTFLTFFRPQGDSPTRLLLNLLKVRYYHRINAFIMKKLKKMAYKREKKCQLKTGETSCLKFLITIRMAISLFNENLNLKKKILNPNLCTNIPTVIPIRTLA